MQRIKIPVPKRRSFESGGLFKNPAPKKKTEIVTFYDQVAFIEAVNYFRKALQQPLLDKRGCCYGLSVAWLKNAAKRKECEFYRMIKKIIAYDRNASDKWASDSEIDQFIKKVWSIQDSQDSFFYTGYVPRTRQSDLATLLKETVNYQCEIFDTTYLDHNLYLMSPAINAILVNGDKTYGGLCHCVAIFKRDDFYYFYNANHESGQAFVVQNIEHLSFWIKESIYSTRGMTIPPCMTLELFSSTLPVVSSFSPLAAAELPHKEDDVQLKLSK